jgi:hypothetical protein
VPVANDNFSEGRTVRMNGLINSRLNMGRRALEFSEANPVESPGYNTTVQQLKAQLARADQLGKEQARGLALVHSTTEGKERVKRELRRSHLVHIAGVVEHAADEVPELARQFDLPRIPVRGQAFKAAVTAMLEEAERQKELLIKHGLVEDVLVNARKALDELNHLFEQSAEARRVHIGASAELQAVTDEIVQLVKILGGFNTFRLRDQPELLAAWTAASNVIGPAKAAQADRRTGGQAAPPTRSANPPASGAGNPAA